MNNQPISFFYCAGDGMFHAQQGTCLISFQFSNSHGFYIHKDHKDHIDSIRRVVALYCVRRLPIYEWHKNTDVFIGRSNDE